MLHYDYLSSEFVQSPRLQTLLTIWDTMRGDDSLPQHEPKLREKLGSHFDYMSCLSVKDVHHKPRFLIVEHGSGIAELCGMNCAGKFLDQSMPPERYAKSAESYLKTMEKKAPIYTVAEITDANGTPVVTEQLYLPFGSPTMGVSHVWFAIEPSSPARVFVRERLLAHSKMPVFVMKAAIEPRTAHF